MINKTPEWMKENKEISELEEIKIRALATYYSFPSRGSAETVRQRLNPETKESFSIVELLGKYYMISKEQKNDFLNYRKNYYQAIVNNDIEDRYKYYYLMEHIIT